MGRPFEGDGYTGEYSEYVQAWRDKGSPEITLDEFENFIWELSYTFDMIKARWVAKKLKERFDIRRKDAK